jgi:minor extracellular protease Epr
LYKYFFYQIEIVKMERTILVFAVIIFLLTTNVSNAKTTPTNTVRIIAHTTSAADKESFESKGCSIKHNLEDATAMECPKDISAQLTNVQEDKLYKIDEDFEIKDMWDNTFIGATEVWNLGYTGLGKKVAILDTGVQKNHPDLQDSIVDGKSFVEYTTDYEDDHGHGTLVAGVITSNGYDESNLLSKYSKGIAPDAGILVAKVCDYDGLCWESDVAAAIEWAVKGPDGVYDSGDEPDVISMSLGSEETWAYSNCDRDYIAKKVNWAVRKGISVVASAGNSPWGVSSPACASKAIAVGASYYYPTEEGWYERVASFSGRGYAMKHHGVVAPGVAVLSTYLNSDYRFATGTSMSAPYVSGLIALMKQKNPTLSPSRIKSTIFRNAVDIGFSVYEQGYGRIDALKSVDRINVLSTSSTEHKNSGYVRITAGPN